MTRSVWRKRRTLKRVGLVLAIMMLGLWGFSVMFELRHVDSSGRGYFAIAYGRIEAGSWLGGLERGWTCKLYYSERLVGAHDPIAFIPVWLLVVAAGFPTAILWWPDRRPEVGFCEVCKYDLTGNVSGRCPECGTSLTPNKAT